MSRVRHLRLSALATLLVLMGGMTLGSSTTVRAADQCANPGVLAQHLAAILVAKREARKAARESRPTGREFRLAPEDVQDIWAEPQPGDTYTLRSGDRVTIRYRVLSATDSGKVRVVDEINGREFFLAGEDLASLRTQRAELGGERSARRTEELQARLKSELKDAMIAVGKFPTLENHRKLAEAAFEYLNRTGTPASYKCGAKRCYVTIHPGAGTSHISMTAAKIAKDGYSLVLITDIGVSQDGTMGTFFADQKVVAIDWANAFSSQLSGVALHELHHMARHRALRRGKGSAHLPPQVIILKSSQIPEELGDYRAEHVVEEFDAYLIEAQSAASEAERLLDHYRKGGDPELRDLAFHKILVANHAQGAAIQFKLHDEPRMMQALEQLDKTPNRHWRSDLPISIPLDDGSIVQFDPGSLPIDGHILSSREVGIALRKVVSAMQAKSSQIRALSTRLGDLTERWNWAKLPFNTGRTAIVPLRKRIHYQLRTTDSKFDSQGPSTTLAHDLLKLESETRLNPLGFKKEHLPDYQSRLALLTARQATLKSFIATIDQQSVQVKRSDTALRILGPNESTLTLDIRPFKVNGKLPDPWDLMGRIRHTLQVDVDSFDRAKRELDAMYERKQAESSE